MIKKKRVKKVKPVINNGKANSPLQFNVLMDNKRDKIVKSKDVFEYKKKK